MAISGQFGPKIAMFVNNFKNRVSRHDSRWCTMIRIFVPYLLSIVVYNQCHNNAHGYLPNYYTGTINVTVSGRTCQKWTVQEPHVPDADYPSSSLEDHNFCRNTWLDEIGAWCYTTDPSERWEFCSCTQETAACIHFETGDKNGRIGEVVLDFGNGQQMTIEEQTILSEQSITHCFQKTGLKFNGKNGFFFI